MNSRQRAYLGSLANNIDPIFQIGKASLTPEIIEAARDHSMWASISVRKISGQVSRTVFLPCLFQRKIRQRQKKRNILPLRNPL